MKSRGHGTHCEIDLKHWSRYLEGEFSSARCRQCEAHLQECAECRARLRDVTETIRACRRAARVALPPDVKARARKRAKTIMGTKGS